jgi:squalene-hopene/tetraprenyl-beta-curcumene cyclase
LLGDLSQEVIKCALSGVNWLLELQNDDGGIPTFCRGWGTLPFDRSSNDITAHVLRAWLAWLHVLPPDEQHRVQNAMSKAVQFLIKQQRDDGSWLPLWFGNQYARGEVNATYGTARVLCALPELAERSYLELVEPLNSGVLWLTKAQNTDGSWGGGSGGPPSIEETALAVEALAESLLQPKCLLVETREQVKNACTWGANWLVSQVESGNWQTPAPIGFYFAKLWYYEKLYPLIFTASALRKVARLL